MNNILPYEVQFAPKPAKLNKVVGLYSVLNEMLTNKFLSEFDSEWFNLVFRNAIISQNWGTAAISKPIPKYFSIDRIDLLQYSAISLLPNLYKIYSCVVNDRLTTI